MKISTFAFIFLLCVGSAALAQKQSPVYVLKYYYPEDTTKIISKRAYSRTVNKDGSFCITDYNPVDLQKQIYLSCYDVLGVPTHYGDGTDMTQIYADSLRMNFRGRDTTLVIKAPEQLKDAAVLWFWKYRPKVNETCTVGGIRKNFITHKIDLNSVSYTYLGRENVSVLGKTTSCHKVKSMPLNGSTGVYDERWFDDKGMLVLEHHIVGKDGMRIGKLTEIIK